MIDEPFDQDLIETPRTLAWWTGDMSYFYCGWDFSFNRQSSRYQRMWEDMRAGRAMPICDLRPFRRQLHRWARELSRKRCNSGYPPCPECGGFAEFKRMQETRCYCHQCQLYWNEPSSIWWIQVDSVAEAYADPDPAKREDRFRAVISYQMAVACYRRIERPEIKLHTFDEEDMMGQM